MQDTLVVEYWRMLQSATARVQFVKCLAQALQDLVLLKIDQEEEEAAANRQRPMPAGARVYENDPFSSGQGPHNTKVYVRNIGRDNRGKISLYSKTPEEGTRGARSTGTGEGDSGQTSSAKTRETGTRETKVKSKQSSSGKDKSSTSTDSKSASAEEETITATVADNLMHVR